jgi:hypothetical protein
MDQVGFLNMNNHPKENIITRNMKKIMKGLILLAAGILLSSVLVAQGPPHPPSGNGNAGDQAPNQVPIDSGLSIFLFLGAGYALRNVFHLKKKTD